jgi:cell division protein FtsQ
MAAKTTSPSSANKARKSAPAAKKPPRPPSAKQLAQQERERKIRLMRMKRHIQLGAVALVFIVLYVGAIYRIDRPITEFIYRKWLEYSHSAGFTFNELLLENRHLTPPEAIIDAVGLEVGDPLFIISLEDIRSRLLTLNTVKNAIVTRDLGGKIIVNLQERVPFILWQHRGITKVIDDEGVVLQQLHPQDYAHLITMVGEKAPFNMNNLATFITENKALMEEITAAVYVSNRRWDIHFSNGLKILLPENDPEIAWKKLIVMHEKNNIFEQHIQAIDLRIKDKVFVTYKDGAQREGKTHNTRAEGVGDV